MRGKNSKRYPTGSMAHENWKQFAALLRQDNRASKGLGIAELSKRVKQSLEPMREHAALVESDKQNEFAARLWKHHAEQATAFNNLRAEIILALVLVLETQPDQRLVVAQQLRMIAEEMQG